jgi:hypothetical protein
MAATTSWLATMADGPAIQHINNHNTHKKQSSSHDQSASFIAGIAAALSSREFSHRIIAADISRKSNT